MEKATKKKLSACGAIGALAWGLWDPRGAGRQANGSCAPLRWRSEDYGTSLH